MRLARLVLDAECCMLVVDINSLVDFVIFSLVKTPQIFSYFRLIQV